MLSGTFDDFSPEDIVRFLAAQRKTGRLNVSTEAGEGSVAFVDGAIGHVSFRDPGSIGEVLFDMLRSTPERFTWARGGVDRQMDVVAAQDILHEVEARFAKLSSILEALPHKHAVLRLSPELPVGMTAAAFDRERWRVLATAAAGVRVGDVVQDAGGDLDSLETLAFLLSSGFLEASNEPPPPAPVPRVIALPERSTVRSEDG